MTGPQPQTTVIVVDATPPPQVVNGTPVPTVVYPTAGASPVPGASQAYTTTQAVEVVNPYLVVSPPVLVPDVAGAVLVCIVVYCMVWAVVDVAERITFAHIGAAAAFLSVLTGSPQYVYGWLAFVLGVLLVRALTRWMGER